MDSVEEVKDTVWNFFNQKFREPDHARPVIERISTRTLIHVGVHYSEAPFSDEEIKETVWCCDRAKSLGPDGYSFVFIKNCWKIMKDDVLNFVKGFHNKDVLSKAITSFFPTLICATDAMVWGKVDPTHYSAYLDYKCFMEAMMQVIMKEDLSMAFRTLWNSTVQTKIKAFGWRAFLNRLATKDQLIKRAAPVMRAASGVALHLRFVFVRYSS
ncbi:hypothetical protein KIW84_075628 [Lathyrus oleraceus]|uniref:Uncharacterized protein n=1 Tax=Pisum sativum TaxID=3888 RepID=A0A9D4VWY3_PEA|nr:hypothetical protein KIW84_075628 [Pisum sativum]